MPLLPEAKNTDISVKKNFRKISRALGYTASPTFVGQTLTGLNTSRLVWTDSSKLLASKDLIGLVVGTANRVTVSDDSSGGVTLTGPQDIHTGASPTFATLLLGEGRFNPRKSRALVTFIFDDGNDTDYTIMKPVFDGQGEVACSAVISDNVGGANKLTEAQLTTMENAGWEILSHSKTHANLPTLNEAQIITELSDSKDALEGMGFTLKNFVYPYNENDAIVRRLTRDYYRSARTNGGLNPQVLKTYELYSYNIDNHTALATYQGYVDTAESEKKWLILYLHTTDSDDATTMGTLIDYIQAKSISIVTVDQALDLIGNMLEIGDNFAIGESGSRITNPEIIMADGGTIGQSAGPLLTFNDTDNQLELTGGNFYALSNTSVTAAGAVAAGAGSWITRPSIRSGGTLDSLTAIADTNVIGKLNYFGHDGSAYLERARIEVIVNGTVDDGTDAVPMDMVFYTGNTSLVEVMRLTSAGNLDIAGNMLFTGAGSGLSFGEINVVGNSTETVIASQNVYVQITVFDTNGESLNVTPDHTNDHNTIVKAGRYFISCSITLNSIGGSGSTAEIEVKKNNGNTRVGSLHVDRTLSGGGTESGAITITGIVNLAVDDTIEVWIKNETNTQNYVVEDITLTLLQIGGA